MRTKFTIPALVAASLFGATAVASAQTQPTQPAPSASESNVGTGSTVAPDRMQSDQSRSGVTTGVAPEGMKPGSVDESKPGGQSTARKPPS